MAGATGAARRRSLDGLPIASMSVDRLFRNSLLALLALGACALPLALLHPFALVSRSVFVAQTVVVSVAALVALLVLIRSARLASLVVSIGVLASVCLGLQGGPLSSSWAMLAVVPMLLLGLQFGRRGVAFCTFVVILARCFWSLKSGRIADAAAPSPLPILIVHTILRSLVILLAGIVIDHLLAIVRERESFLIDVFRDIDIGVSVFDVDEKGVLRIAALNPRIHQLLGLPRGPVLGKKHDELLSGGHLQATEPMLQRAVSTGEPQHNEDRVRSGDKHQRLLFTAVPQRDKDQHVKRLVVSGTDITQLKEAERKLQMQAQVLANVADAVIAVNPNFRVTYFNRAAARLFVAKDKQILGEPLEEMTGAEFVREMRRLVGETPSTQSGTFVDGVGRELALDFSVSTQRDEDDNSVAQYLVVIRDVRERRSLEAQLLRAQKTDALGRMAGGIAHDFNNMLVVISGNAELLAESLPSEHEGQADLREIKDAAQRAATLVRQLLAFSRRQTGTPRATNLNQVLRDIHQILRRLLRDEIELEFKLSETLWSVVIDVAQLEQVMVQLLLNSRDAIPKAGKITISTRNVELGPEAERHGLSKGPYVELRISDTGIGMSAETMLHLFEPFFSTKSSSRAVGLGLSVCYGIIRQHRGVITAESKPGEGSSFVIWLPEENHKPREEKTIPSGSVSDEFRRMQPLGNRDGKE